jgi:hypothetical protein
MVDPLTVALHSERTFGSAVRTVFGSRFMSARCLAALLQSLR